MPKIEYGLSLPFYCNIVGRQYYQQYCNTFPINYCYYITAIAALFISPYHITCTAETRAIATDTVAWSICATLLGTPLSPAEWLIGSRCFFEGKTCMAPKNHVLDKGRISQRKGALCERHALTPI